MRLRALLSVIVLFVAATRPAAGEPLKVKDLPRQWQVWLEEEVYPLISSVQRKAFLELETEDQRKAFVERLWQLWGSQYGFGSSFRRLYEERLDECRVSFDHTTEDRCRLLLIHGAPDFKKTIDCQEVFVPMEFWAWSHIEGLGDSVTVLFYKPYGVGQFRLWDPFETRLVLYTPTGESMARRYDPNNPMSMRPEERCGDERQLLSLMAAAEYWGNDNTAKARMAHFPVERESDSESATARFMKFSTIVADDSKELAFEVTPSSGGRRGGLVRESFAVDLPREGLGTNKVGDEEVVQLDVVGEISRDGEPADRFRYGFTVPAASTKIPLVVERELRPGKYHLRLKLDDQNSKLAGVREVDFEVKPPADGGERPEDTAAAAAIQTVKEQQKRVISLQGPATEGLTGVQRFNALVAPDVASVEFYLDGKPVLTKNRPPFEVELDLGPLPRLAAVTAVAYDRRGAEIDRAQLQLNVGRERFFVRLQPIGPADVQGTRVHAVANLNIPTDRKLSKLDVFWNETPVSTLYQPPFDTWVPMSGANETGYVRVLATLDDGSQAEDLQFVNGPQFISGVQVDAVELPVAVLDKQHKPVEGVPQAAFHVFEDGVPQTLSHFALQQDLPIRLGLVIDTSGSMEKTLPDVQRVVLGFLRNLLRPRDRAFIVAFSDRPQLIEGFTADFGSLERALIALRAERETALFDATVYGLFQFSGVRGRKALVILSDGKDNVSEMSFEKTLDYAVRSGVTVYTIGIGLPVTEIRTRSQLGRLAQSTGGEAFFLARDSSLQPVYDQIEQELRTQYLLAYTSSSTAPTEEFRKVEVTVDRPGVDVRTIAGYYPAPS